jgi:hypothetical protein
MSLSARISTVATATSGRPPVALSRMATGLAGRPSAATSEMVTGLAGRPSVAVFGASPEDKREKTSVQMSQSTPS